MPKQSARVIPAQAGIEKPRKNTLPRAGSFLRSVVGYCADEEPMASTWIPAFAGMTGRLVCGSAHRALYTRRAGHFDRLPPRGSTPSDRLKSSQLHFHCLRCASVPPPAPPPSVAFFALFSGSRATFSTSSICSAKTNVTFFRTVLGCPPDHACCARAESRCEYPPAVLRGFSPSRLRSASLFPAA